MNSACNAILLLLLLGVTFIQADELNYCAPRDLYDLTGWQEVAYTGNVDWEVYGTSAVEKINSDATWLLSDISYPIGSIFGGQFMVGLNSDDDYFGFVFGQQKQGNIYSFYLFDWKRQNQFPAVVGTALSYISWDVSGTFPQAAFFYHQAPLVELQRGINYGSTGYFQQQIYQIAVLLETDKIKVWIDSILEIDYQPHSTQFTNGLFGLYANSQQDLYVSFNLLCYPSASSSPTTSPTPSASATSSQSVSPSRTPSRTATRTPTKSPSLSSSISITPSISVTKSVSVSSSRTPSRTPTSSRSYSRTPRGTRTPTSTITPTITVTRTITPTITPTSTQSFTPTITPTVSDTPTKTITITPTSYPSRTPQASQSATPSASTSGFPYNYYYITDAPSKTAAASVTQSHSVSKSPSDSVTISPSATSTPTPSISLTISISPSATPSFNLCLISDCEDYDPCTDDSCNFELGVCVNVNNYLCGLLGGSGEVPTRSMTPSLKLLPPVFLPPESLSPSPTSNFLPKVSGGFGIQDNNNNKFGAAHHNDPIIGASSTGVVTFIGAVAISCAFCFAFAIGCAADKKAKKDRLQEVMNIIETTGDGYDPSRIVDSALFSPNH